MPEAKPYAIHIYAAAVTAVLAYDFVVDYKKAKLKRLTAENHKRFFDDRSNTPGVAETKEEFIFLLQHTPMIYTGRN